MVRPFVKLVTKTCLAEGCSDEQSMLGIMWFIWHAAKTENRTDNLWHEAYHSKVLTTKQRELFAKNSTLSFPPPEFIDFTFLFENVPIAFREQLVRTRSATHWWETSRISDFSKFFDNGKYFISEGAKTNKQKLLIKNSYKLIQKQYKAMLKAGLKNEEARYVLPSGALTRGFMKINLRNLITLISKRTCSIAQGELWSPIIKGIKAELKLYYGDLFDDIFRTPCTDCNGKFTGCKFQMVNEERLSGEDPLPVCQIYKKNGGVKNA